MSADSPHAVRPSARVCDEILAERVRQMEVEGWSATHDDEHAHGELALAAAAYAYVGHSADPHFRRNVSESGSLRFHWPWPVSAWKPKDRRRDLIRAAALLVAEIERLDRLQCLGVEPDSPWPRR